MTLSGNWNYPTSIRFGAGRISELADACRELGINKPLVATDPVIATLPIMNEAVQALEHNSMNYAVFSDIDPNPVGDDVDRGCLAYHSSSCDGVIAFGGGAALDVAKAIALMVHQKRPLWDFEDIGDYWTRVDEEAMVPCVAVPTTSGTGSEVGRASVIINEEQTRKAIIFHPKMLPGRVIAAPALTIGLPAKITAAVGMDALSHNLEALCAPSFHPQAEGIAIEGMRLISQSLIRTFEDGSDIEARAHMMVASLMGAAAFQKGLGAMHAMSHPIGAHLKAHHGLINAIVMPYVLEHNKTAIELKMKRLSQVLELAEPGTNAVIRWVNDLRKKLNIPNTLTAINMQEHHCKLLAPLAVQDPSAGGNPIALTEKDYEKLFRTALNGH